MNNVGQNEKIDEQALLEKVAVGDWHAFADIYNFYVPKLHRFIYPFVNHNKEDIEEVIQDVFLKLWKKREELTAVRSFEAYLFRMAKNQLIDLKKQHSSQQRIIAKITPRQNVYDESVHDKLVYSEYHKLAKAALDLLTPQRRKIFEMRVEEEMSIDEIASQLNISRSAVKKQLYEAIHFVKKHISHDTDWPVLFWLIVFLS